jgi:hypothetical protein
MQKVISAFEKVSFPDLGIFDVVAKVDTGALSGALHATRIKEVKLRTGEMAVSFLPFGKKPQMEVVGFQKKEIRSSNGIIQERYIVPTVVVIEGAHYPINISLSDRSQMMKGVLLGRNFLREHGFLVDANGGSQYRYEVK